MSWSESCHRLRAENIGAGDTILVNDPYGAVGDLNDITLITPVYYNDAPFGYVANVAHHVDVGGGAPASVGAFREVYQEGVIIPPVKFGARGEDAARHFSTGAVADSIEA